MTRSIKLVGLGMNEEERPVVMRDKYILESYPLYFEFGKSIDGTRVDISNGSDDTVATLSEEHAAKIIAEHNKAIHKLVDTAIAFAEANPKEFSKFWYGDE